MPSKLITWLLCLLLISAFLFCSKKVSTQPEEEDSIPDLEGWTLVWNDEFNGNSIDAGKWEHEVNANGGGNNELQYYTDRQENSYIEDGNLVIKAIKERYTGDQGTREYTSARLRTAHKGDWKYGRFDIRARLPYGQGLWPAIWMLPTDWIYGGWAASGEIDVMELLGQEPNKVYGTIHYGGSYPDNTHSGCSTTLSSETFSEDFHLFTLEWDTTEIRWYVDGNLYCTRNQWYSANGQYPAPFDQRFHMLLNVAVGGNWPGDPDNSTVFPQYMFVDYVRVYKKTE
ncbi:MAG: glycoside hydrolase family 16 protein [Calditrichaeota bacterium]|nr:MAG: glycoside hydrolase family 16 protein [Calditrichota bacterium]